MSGETLAQAGPAAVSILALVLSLATLYLQRKDRRPRLRIRVRYEYRAAPSEGATSGEGPPTPEMHDGSQEGLYLLLGDFLREHGLWYPRGTPVVRFALSNEGERQIFLDTVRLVVRPGSARFGVRAPGERRVLDPTEGKVLPAGLAGRTANVLASGGEDGGAVQLAPGDGVGYRFGLIRLADVLKGEGFTGNVRLALEATDRLGNVYRRPFEVNTDLWAHPAPEED